MNYYQVAVNYPKGSKNLTYQSQHVDLPPGLLVSVPLGKRVEKGCVIEKTTKPTGEMELKSIGERLDDTITISPVDLALFKWMAKYYHYPLGKLIFDSLPKLLKRPRKMAFELGEERPMGFSMTEHQAKICRAIVDKGQGFSKSLIHGVTGSGKTVIYIELIKNALKNNLSVLYLLPEINLTRQFVDTFKKHLGAKIFVYNSSIANSEKYVLWQTLTAKKEAVVVIGVRSAVFLPFLNLGLIVVDEEHDLSFKQDDRCPFNGRDVAVKKASLYKVPIVLGSATPALETYQAFKGGDGYFSLTQRPGERELPTIEFVDSKTLDMNVQERGFLANFWPLTARVHEAITLALAKGEQVLVLINRLGYANFVQCRSCGHQFECRNCTSVLKFFKAKNRLQCQHCDYAEAYPHECPECGNMELLQKGFGTEKVAGELDKLFAQKTIARFDRETLTTHKQLNEVLDRFHAGKIDILVGTQMLSKGHNFKKANTVVVLGVDSQLNFPDFRAEEKVFQLLNQVAGRAGRFSGQGQVLIQTNNPDNPLFSFIDEKKYGDFSARELKLRRQFEWPPASKLISLCFSSKKQKWAQEAATQFCEMAQALKVNNFGQVELLGPRPSFIEKRANMFSWNILLKSSDINQLHNLLISLKKNARVHHSVHLKCDIDPQSFH